MAALQQLLVVVTAAFLLLSTSYSLPTLQNAQRLLEDMKAEITHTKATAADKLAVMEQAMVQTLTKETNQLKMQLYAFHSSLLCRHISCAMGDVYYDPLIQSCRCPWAIKSVMSEDLLWPAKECGKKLICTIPYKPVWDQRQTECVCSIESLPAWGDDAKQIYKPIGSKEMMQKLFPLWEKMGLPAKHSKIHSAMDEDALEPIRHSNLRRNQPAPTSVATDAVPQAPQNTYVPQPETEITASLIEQSLAIQPQEVATVASVVPYFAEGIISFHVQLDGPVLQTLVLNATDSLPCDSVGMGLESNVILIPRSNKNGIPQVTVPTCLIIAVNTYEPRWITYWIQNLHDGTIYSILGDSKVHNIDQLDTSAPAALSIRVASAGVNDKRSISNDFNLAGVDRRQILLTPCGESCPDSNMEVIARDAYRLCGCVSTDHAPNSRLVIRALVAPDAYTATMTAETCAAMVCFNNGGNPAVFNNFTRTCWCTSPIYVDFNPSAHVDMM